MNDEIQQSVPEPQPEQPILPQPILPKPIDITKKGSIDKLPPEIIKDIEEYFQNHNGIATVKYIKEKYAEQYPHLKTLTKATVYTYAKKRNLKTLREVVLATEITKTSPEFLKFMTAAGDPNSRLEDKRAAYVEIFNFYTRISNKLEASQANFTDPQTYAVITRLNAQKVEIINALTKYDEKVLQIKQIDILDETDYIVGICTTALNNAYRLTHKDQSLYSEFITNYRTAIKELFRAYRAAKETLKANPIKID